MKVIEHIRLMRDGANSSPTVWNDIIGLNVDRVNILVEMSGDGLPDSVEVKVESRAPNRAPGPTTMTSPAFFKLPRVEKSSSYFLSIPIDTLGDFLAVRTPVRIKLATLHRPNGTSDAEFRAAGKWVMRGIGVQPDTVGGNTGNQVGEAPDAMGLLKAGGVEVLDVSIPHSKGNNILVRDSRVVRLIRSPADIFYYSGHGGTDLLIHARSGYESWISAAELLKFWPRQMDLDVLIIAGCSTLELAMTDWAKFLTVRGGPLIAILGYRKPDPLTEEQRRQHQSAHSAPDDKQGGNRIAAEIARKIVGGSQRIVMDWLEVNQAHKIGGINAAALDENGYHWQEFEHGKISVKMIPISAV